MPPTAGSSIDTSTRRRNKVKERTVSAENAGKKLCDFIVQEFRDVFRSRSDSKAALRQKRVRVNGQITLDSYMLETGDQVQVEIDEEYAIRHRLHGLDVQLKYSEAGLVVLLKAPGVSRPDVEWAAAALQIIEANSRDQFSTCKEVTPWIAINEVDKALRSLIVLIDSRKRQEAIMQFVNSGRVRFTLCALCHGNIKQETLDDATSKSIAASAKATIIKESDAQDEVDNKLRLFNSWFAHNNLPSDIFDSVKVKVEFIAKSTAVGHLSMIQGSVTYSTHPSLVLRRFMFELGHATVGSQSYSKELSNHRGKGSMLAFVKVEFPSLLEGNKLITINEDVSPKLLAVCKREIKFFEQRQMKTRAEVEKANASGDVNQNIDLIDGKPAAYITGYKEFCGHTFRVTTDTLIPRTSTEALVKTVISVLDTNVKPRIMDLGTGSGCILLSVLLSITSATGVGVDISKSALSVAQDNCKRHKLVQRSMFLQGTFEHFTTDPIIVANGPFDIIVCNPPYVSASKAAHMRASIEYEPRLALVADDGGYQSYTTIHESLAKGETILTSHGCIVFEIGKDMEKVVRNIFRDWKEVGATKDSSGFLRVLVFQCP
ncbi:S-adenosyl-L-methionine-dependent methyltransferase [Coemansia reversa NRRL 1564]|uniref:S-adenosyl-L-methionine-dependent methyltransferase n=1 Tax=Coemansia reversa (strain ATCC 12441 / NRRL 1564) TaxID=763665 RepID=A0A2G5BAA0_COERN|nr:S-adenosyl-L-methionine-dependent methyltransferase [Coemansia reversa NRRL 1564]|eukprot:PIA15934.1 S-adenosyl-L-methionine-dependent methyltransferase [Coemansia reversa NRRL 1564]